MAEAKEKIWIKLLNVRHPFARSAELTVLVKDFLQIQEAEILNIQILRRSIDARQERIDVVYTFAVELAAEQHALQNILRKKDVEQYTPEEAKAVPKVTALSNRPVIIGCGPSGLFAALTLVERGAQPILIERGSRMAQRVRDVDMFWESGKLNPESNVFFGEGGAGTFSDGKLTTRIKSPLKEKVLKELVKSGAPEEIRYSNKPHLGTDRIRRIIRTLVKGLEQKGVEFIYDTRVRDIRIEEGRVTGVVTGDRFIETDNVFLATGHSARDIYQILEQRGAELEPKGFAMGLRIEHPQELINKNQWGRWEGTAGLGPADYFLTFHDNETGRGVYTFCMCPGGYVISCSTQNGELVTNGMSAYQRNSPWANAAIVVTIGPDDFTLQGTMAGIEFQRQTEMKAFRMGGGEFCAPVQTAKDFLAGRAGDAKNITCSYRPGIVCADLGALLPAFIIEPLKRALMHFDKKMPGFIEEGVLIGVETRTSSPVRIKRDPKTFHASGSRGLIPIGEGSGYAGGIVSCAVDGIRAALCFDEN